MEENQVLELLKELNQDHIIEKYKSSSKEEQKEFLIQFNKLDKACRGGFKGYLNRAKILLEESKNKVNHFSDTTIEIPDDIPHIDIYTPEFFELDQLGFNQLKDTVFWIL